MANDLVKFEIRGLDEAMKAMGNVSVSLKKKALRVSLKAGAEILKAAVIANAKTIDDPHTSEKIWKNVRAQFTQSKPGSEFYVKYRIGVRGGAAQYGDTKVNRRKGRAGQTYETGGSKGNPGGDTWYWRMVEFGTEHSAANPFLRTAFSENQDRIETAVADELKRQIDTITK